MIQTGKELFRSGYDESVISRCSFIVLFRASRAAIDFSVPWTDTFPPIIKISAPLFRYASLAASDPSRRILNRSSHSRICARFASSSEIMYKPLLMLLCDANDAITAIATTKPPAAISDLVLRSSLERNNSHFAIVNTPTIMFMSVSIILISTHGRSGYQCEGRVQIL